MKMKICRSALGMFVLLAGLTCSVGAELNKEQGEFKFIVADSRTKVPLEGVDVTLMSSREVPVGRTNYLGVAKINTSALKDGDPRAVLFCAERFFCGAIKIDAEFFEYSEMYIELAPFAVR